jgi:hypothetical protein
MLQMGGFTLKLAMQKDPFRLGMQGEGEQLVDEEDVLVFGRDDFRAEDVVDVGGFSSGRTEHFFYNLNQILTDSDMPCHELFHNDCISIL